MSYGSVRAVFLDAGHTLLYTDPPVELVYREAFARHGVDATLDAVHEALHETWQDVATRHREGEERWGGHEGEPGFWRQFVTTVYARLGGAELPRALLKELVDHFQKEQHWRVYDDVVEVLVELRKRGYKL